MRLRNLRNSASGQKAYFEVTLELTGGSICLSHRWEDEQTKKIKLDRYDQVVNNYQ